MIGLAEALLWSAILLIGPPLLFLGLFAQGDPPPPRSGEDDFLLLLLATFYLTKAILIERQDRLGWALCLSQVSLGMLFGWAYGVAYWPVLQEPALATGLRKLAVVSVFWAIFELLWVRFLVNCGPVRMIRLAWRNRRANASRDSDGD